MTRSKFTHGMIERLLVINNELGTEKYPNTPKLAKKLEVSIATISRDVEFLRDRLNAPIEYSFEKKAITTQENINFWENLKIMF